MLIQSVKKIVNKIDHKKLKVLLLFAFMFLGGVLRFHNISSQSYWMDEGYTINAVLSINETGTSVLDSGQAYSCPNYCYPTAYFSQIFGQNAFSYRFLSAVFGILFILVIFTVIRKLFNHNIALISSFFITFSYWQIAWSRQARWYTLFSLVFWLALYFFYQSIYSDKNKYLNITLTTIFSIVAILTHGLAYLLPFIFIGWFLINQIFIQKKFNWKKDLLIILGGIIILWLFNFISNIDILSYLSNKLSLHYVLPYYLNFYLRNYWLFIILAIIAFFNKNVPYEKEIYFLLFTLVSYLIPLTIFTDIVHYRYMFHLTPIFLILGSIGLLNLHEEIKPLYGKIILWIIAFCLFATIAGGVFIPQTNYYLESDNPKTLNNRPYYAYTPQPNWNSAYAFIKGNKTVEDIIISSHPHFNKLFLGEAGYWIKYDYLGFDNKADFSQNDREYYVGAKIINDLEEFKTITTSNHGFIVFDYMSTDGRISEDIQNYIKTTLSLIFHEKTNSYSEVWIYRF